MLRIADEVKIIQQSTTESERQQRMRQLQQRLHEDALRRKLRNVRLIGSVERLSERAASLRQLTDRLRLIKRQYEVLATHLPDDDTGDQSQHAQPMTQPRSSQSAASLSEAHQRQVSVSAGLGAGDRDVAAGASPLVEGYYDPRLAARGWQGDADPWGPASQRLGRDELGRSTESRAALLRARIATSLTVRPEPPPPPSGGHGGNYPPPGGHSGNYNSRGAAGAVQGWQRERGPEWDCGVASGDQPRTTREDQSDRDRRGYQERPELQDLSTRDPSGWDRSTRDPSMWDRSGPEDRVSSAPMRDRSVSEYSVSAPGRRRAAPPAWDGTLDGVASRWGTLERPAAADEQLQQLDSALARQRQLLTATAAAAAAVGERTGQQGRTDARGAPLPRLRTGSWLDPEHGTSEQQRNLNTDGQSRFREDDTGFRDQDRYPGERESHARDQGRYPGERESHVRDQDQYPGERESQFRDQDLDRRGREANVRFQDSLDEDVRYQRSQDRGRGFLDRKSSQEHHQGYSSHEASTSRRESEPRCPEHQALHDAARQNIRRQHDDGEQHYDHAGYPDASGGGDGRRLGSVSEYTELGAEGSRAKEVRTESGHGADWGGSGEVRRQGSVTGGTRESWGAEDGEGATVDQGLGVRRRESGVRSHESGGRRPDIDSQEPSGRRQESREEEQRWQREEEERRIEVEERRQAEQQAVQRKTSVASSASSNGDQRRGSRTTEVSAATQQRTPAAFSTGAGASRGQAELNGSKQTSKKKRNMDWLLEGGRSSSAGSDDGGIGGSTSKPIGGSTGKQTDGAAEAVPSPESRPTPASRQGSHGAAAPAPAADPGRAADTSSSDEAAPAAAPAAAAAPEKPVKLRLDSGSDSYHLSADLGGDDSDDDFWG